MTRSITLRGADGSVWDLIDGPVRAGTDPQLWGTTNVQLTERSSAVIPGTRITQRRHDGRDLVVPIVLLDPQRYPTTPVTGAAVADGADMVLVDTSGATLVVDGPDRVFNPVTLEDVVAGFARAIDSVRGDVTITVTRVDDTARTIVATYQAGFNGLAHADHTRPWITGQVAFRAADPYWAALEDEAVVVTPPMPVFTQGTTPFGDPTIPFNAQFPFDGLIVDDVLFNDPGIRFDGVVGFSGAAGVRLIVLDNDGDVADWPTFTITGPASAVGVDNVSSGRMWRMKDLASDETLRIVTQPGVARVEVSSVNAYGRLVDRSQLWPLGPGRNVLAVKFTGAEFTVGASDALLDQTNSAVTDESGAPVLAASVEAVSAVSKFRMTFRPRYLTC